MPRRLCEPGATLRASGAPADRAGRGVRHGAHLRGDQDARPVRRDHRARRRRPAAAIDAPVLDTLRLGTHQLLGMRVPTHAATAETVALARQVHGQGAAGFVNAVLRRVGGTRPGPGWPRPLPRRCPCSSGWPSCIAPPAVGGHRAARRAHRARQGERQTVQPELVALLESDNTAPQVTLAAPARSRRRGRAARGRSAARALGRDERDSAHGDPGALDAVRRGPAAARTKGPSSSRSPSPRPRWGARVPSAGWTCAPVRVARRPYLAGLAAQREGSARCQRRQPASQRAGAREPSQS